MKGGPRWGFKRDTEILLMIRNILKESFALWTDRHTDSSMVRTLRTVEETDNVVVGVSEESNPSLHSRSRGLMSF